MVKRRALNKQNNKLMAEKVKIIYKYLAHGNDEELLELLLNRQKVQENPKHRLSRKKVLQRYLKKNASVNVQNIQKEYTYFDISKLHIGDEPLFSVEAFILSDLDTFTQRILAYNQHQKELQQEFDIQYTYIYCYDHSIEIPSKMGSNMDKIQYYEIDYSNTQILERMEDSWQIEVKPPRNKSFSDIYEGMISYHQHRIILTLENNFDYLMMLFDTTLQNLSLKYFDNHILYGLALGINNGHQKVPIAKKVIMTEKKMTDAQIENIYLSLNETEVLYAYENLEQDGKSAGLNMKYLEKYEEKISAIHTFFSNVKYSEHIKTQLPQHMIFTEYHAFKEMFNKFAQNQDYFLYDRKRIYLEFLRYLEFQKEKKAYVVLPIFDQDDNIFLYESLDKKTIKDLFIALAKSGVIFEIIFVINDILTCKEDSFYKILQALDEAGINLAFVYKDEIEKIVGSYDFFYSQSHSYVVSKNHMLNNKNFTIIQNKHYIRDYVMNFNKIYKQSFSYEDLQNKTYPRMFKSTLLEKLIGRWHFYFYGSFETVNNEQMLWQTQLEIDPNLRVVHYASTRTPVLGTIRLEANQSLISLFNEETKNSSYISLNNRMVKNITLVTLYTKQFHKDFDMMSIGLISREKLEISEVKNLLGESEKSMLKVDPHIQERIDNFMLQIDYI